MKLSDTEVKQVIAEILSTTLERPVLENEIVSRQQEGKWDSLKHVEIIFSLESAFNIQFTETEMSELNSSDVILTYVLGHLNEHNS
jgi:acyl carrier protein